VDCTNRRVIPTLRIRRGGQQAEVGNSFLDARDHSADIRFHFASFVHNLPGNARCSREAITVSGSAAQFPQTLWSMVWKQLRASTRSRDALATLCRRMVPLIRVSATQGKSRMMLRISPRISAARGREAHLTRAQPDKGSSDRFYCLPEYFIADERTAERKKTWCGEHLFAG